MAAGLHPSAHHAPFECFLERALARIVAHEGCGWLNSGKRPFPAMVEHLRNVNNSVRALGSPQGNVVLMVAIKSAPEATDLVEQLPTHDKEGPQVICRKQ